MRIDNKPLKGTLAAVVLTLCSINLPANAAPAPLVIDEKSKPKMADKHIESVHAMITNPHHSLATSRYAILKGMRDNKGVAWLIDGEGDGYVNARFDYKGHVIIVRIEYTADAIQVKYLAGSEAYVCENNQNGICYMNNHGRYYKYTRNLTKSIRKALDAIPANK